MHPIIPQPQPSQTNVKAKLKPTTAKVIGTLPLVAALLAACSAAPLPKAAATDSYDYSLTLSIKPGDKASDLEARYGGEAVVWNPDAGLAVLGLYRDGLAPQAVGSDPNQDAFSIPSVNALGYTAWGGGYTAWGGGYTAWGGGYTAWGGGTDAPTTFSGNTAYWNQINLTEAQRLTPRLGAGIKVAVIDTGVDLQHPALQGKLAPANEWKDFVDGDNYPQDDQGSSNAGYGHGTGVAGVVLQVAPNATILPIRVLDSDGRGDLINVARAVDWAIRQGADVLNLSLGTYLDSATLEAVVNYAARYRVYVVTSAGNSGDDHVTFPAVMAPDSRGVVGRYLVSVGSVSGANVKSAFSSFGPEVELVAPGERVLTLAPGGVMNRTGTSFAAPMASGALALVLAETKLPPGQGTRDLVDTGDRGVYAKNPAYTGMLGNGTLDVSAFIKRALRK